MKRIFLSFAVIAAAALSLSAGNNNVRLRFSDGSFKIAQITDPHWGYGSDTLAEEKMILKLISDETPDLIICTGDNVTSAHTLEAGKQMWRHFIGILESTGIPYAIVQGNHDAESCPGINADVLEEWISELAPHCLNYPTTSRCFGHGNKTLPIYSEKGEDPAALVYVIDSNDYPRGAENAGLSSYDWIHYDQIEWYRQESQHYIEANGGKALPALCFYHICVPEYDFVAADRNHFGAYTEKCCPPDINTGFFAACKMQRDVMAHFVGHDHGNDFCGVYRNVALCYGRQSGAQGLDPNAPMGIRFIEFNEGERAFATWIDTMEGREATWYYPSCFNTGILDSAMPAQQISPKDNGVSYRYFEGGENDLTTKAMNTKKHFKGQGTLNNFNLSAAKVEDHFGFTFDTCINVPEDEAYCFYVGSDDGSIFSIDGQVLLDQDGDHGQGGQVFVGLKKGWHTIHIDYFENTEGQGIDISYTTLKNQTRREFSDSELYVK